MVPTALSWAWHATGSRMEEVAGPEPPAGRTGLLEEAALRSQVGDADQGQPGQSAGRCGGGHAGAAQSGRHSCRGPEVQWAAGLTQDSAFNWNG